MARFPVQHYVLMGALLGLLSTLSHVLFYALYFGNAPLRGYSRAQLAWGMVQQGLTQIVVCAVLGAVVGMLVSRRILAPFRVQHYALVGTLLGLVPTVRSYLLYSRHIPYDPSRGFTEAQLVWASLQRAVPEIVVSAVLGAVVGILVSRRRRSTDLAGVRSEGLSGINEQWWAERRSFLLVTGLAITALLSWGSPRLLLYPGLGVATVWLITRVAGWRAGAGSLIVGGLLGEVAHFWLADPNHRMLMMFYLVRWGALGIIVNLGFITLQVLGPTLLVMGLTSPRPSKPATA
jgi:hypothetical protein